MKLADIEVDAEKIEQGDWVGDIPEMGDLRLKVRGLQNAEHRRLQQKLIEALPRAKKVGGRIDPDELERITNLCLVDTVLLDWQGIEGSDGQPLPYSKEAARDLLLSPKYKRFRDAVIWAAGNVGEQEAEGEEADRGNSQNASAGI